MPVQSHENDILPHIHAPQGSTHATLLEVAPESLEAKTMVGDSCITLFSIAGASIKVCYSISGDNITVTAKLTTPFGDITLGKAVLNAQRPTITLGGGVAGFKAEVTLTLDVNTLVLTIQGKICAPLVGCKSGSTSVHL